MTQPEVAIVDYQMGNLRSVQKALEHVGTNAVITGDASVIAAAKRVILPGVGAFADAIHELQSRDLVQPLLDTIAAGKPFLGICLGLQMLFEVGYEGGENRGLSILGGSVQRFELPNEYKIPHMGWNQVKQSKLDCPLFQNIPADAYFYFVHSYYVKPADAAMQWLACDYGGEFCAAVWSNNMFATQFHPEKSQKHGLTLLGNFARLPG